MNNGLFCSSILKHFPCIIEKDGDKVAYLYEETGRKFLESADFLEHCEDTIASSTVNDNEDAVHSKEYRYVCTTKFNRLSYSIIVLLTALFSRKLVSKEGQSKAVPSWVSIAMNRHPSFHGRITRVDATKLLFEKGKDCYLTRYSDYHKTCVISVLKTSEDGELLQHFKLHITVHNGEHKYEVKGSQKQFGSIFALLEFYQQHPVNYKIYNIGECLKCVHISPHRRDFDKRHSSLVLVSEYCM